MFKKKKKPVRDGKRPEIDFCFSRSTTPNTAKNTMEMLDKNPFNGLE